MIDRQQASFLSFHERILLRGMAVRLPVWVTPDRLTAFGVLGSVIVLCGYLLSETSVHWLWLANFGLLVNWFGDSLDGTVARVRKIERPNYGFFLDQTIDVFSNLLIAIGVGFSPWCRMDAALLMLTSYHMLSIHTFVRSVVTRRFHVDVGGLGPTEMRLAIALMNVAIMQFGAPQILLLGQVVTWCDVLIIVAAVALMGLFLHEIHKEALTQLKRDQANSLQ